MEIIFLFILISLSWFFRQTKAILFWLYLWQLKEYHIGRFIDHFRTEKGKKLFFNSLFILKIILFFYALSLAFYPKLLPLPAYASWIFLLIVFYFFEVAKFFLDLIQKRLKKPVLTKKTSVLISSALIFEIIFISFLFLNVKNFYWFTFYVLTFDLLTPFISSVIVLIFQLPTVFFRNQIIEKAKKKRLQPPLHPPAFGGHLEQFKNLLVIGITGSYGKTSTKEFLTEILSEKFKVLKTKEHQNSEVGISQCILNDLKPEHEIFICEMGAYNRGGIKLLSDIAKPKIGIITGANEQHLATFGSMENLLSAEGGKELIDSLPQDGFVIFNGNNKYCHELYKKTKIKKKITYTTISTIVENMVHKDIWAENIKIEKEWVEFKVFSKDGDSADFKVNLLGAQNVENILLATATVKELGMNLNEISKACEKIKPEQGGMKILKGINDINIIDSTYSANPDGVISHLEYLKTWPGKKVIIMPCLIELGKATIEVHQRIGQKIAGVCDLVIITTKERFKEIKEGATERGMREEKTLFLENPKEIFEKIKSFCQKEDVLLLEGRLPREIIELLTVEEFHQGIKPISISLSPNIEKDDIDLALKSILKPKEWKRGEKIEELEEEFKKYLGVKYAISFNGGRSALLAILKSLELKEGEEVLLQAFTCNAAVNPILWAQLIPVFVDVNENTFNIDIEDLKRKITPQSKVVMVQHTFGLPADIDDILEICQKNNLILIEDCAHPLGATYKGKKVGTFGRAAFFSFSRDKAISSVYGGMAITNDDNLAKKLKEFQKKIGYSSNFWIFQQLLHPILMNYLILPTYKILGKYLLILFQWLQILSKAVHWKEKRGKKPGYFPKKLPNALAILALNQLKKLGKFNNHRKEIAKFYFEELKNTPFKLPEILNGHIFLRFPIKHPKAHQIPSGESTANRAKVEMSEAHRLIKKAWKSNLLIGDWYDKVIAPHDTKLDKMKYILGSCPKAEKLAKETFNLPTHINISKDEAQKIVEFLKSYGC